MIRMTLTMVNDAKVWRDFETQIEAEQYVSEVTAKGNWGVPQQIIHHEEIPAIPAQPIQPAVFDAHGVEISPMIPATEAIPGIAAWTEIIPGFTVIYEDITAKLEQEKVNADSLKFLADTDWYVLRAQEDSAKPIPEEIKAQRAAARAAIIRG